MKFTILTLAIVGAMASQAHAQLVSHGSCSKLENKCIIDDGRIFDCDGECLEDASPCKMEIVYNGITNTQVVSC